MKTRRIISAALACAVLGGALPCADISADETDWRQLYRNKLYDFMSSEKFTEQSAFELCDMNGDAVPELIISEGTTHDSECHVYTYSPHNDKFIDLGTLGFDGTIGYCSARNAILSRDASDGLEQGILYHLKNRNNLTKIMSYSKETNAATVYKINDKEVLGIYYRIALADYDLDSFEWLGRKNDLTREEIDSALTVPWRELYADTLRNIRESEGYSCSYRFELYDINDDGIPELFISDGSSNTSSCSVYTVYNGEIDFLYKFTDPYVRYYTKGKILKSSNNYGSHSFEEFFTLSGGFLKREISFETISGSDNFVYAIDGETVSSEDFFKEHDKYAYKGNTVFLGRKYCLGDSVIDNVLYPPEMNLSAEQKTLYTKVLIEALLADKHDYDTGKFDLCDFDGDGAPELIIDPILTPKKIYTINEEKTIALDELYGACSLFFDADSKLIYNEIDSCEIYAMQCFSMKDSSLSQLFSTSMSCKHSENGDFAYDYKINDLSASKEQYDSELSEYRSTDNLIHLGSQYSLDYSGISSALYSNTGPLTQLKIICLACETIPGNITEDLS